jgi:hypothetical protein
MERKDYKFLKVALHKRYFDSGFSLLNYLKYPLVLMGFVVKDIQLIIIVSILYAVSCYFLGWWWLNYGMMDAETEIGNRYNPFVKELRGHIRKQKI